MTAVNTKLTNLSAELLGNSFVAAETFPNLPLRHERARFRRPIRADDRFDDQGRAWFGLPRGERQPWREHLHVMAVKAKKAKRSASL